MGTIVNYDAAEARAGAGGLSVATLIDKESTEMHASLLRLNGGRYEATVPAGSDQYLFVIDGRVRIEAAGPRRSGPWRPRRPR